jgi:hypothetical protein
MFEMIIPEGQASVAFVFSQALAQTVVGLAPDAALSNSRIKSMGRSPSVTENDLDIMRPPFYIASQESPLSLNE